MPSPIQYTVVEMTDEELAEERRVFGGLAESVRALAEASLRTTVPAEEVGAIRAEVDALTKRLADQQIDGSFGTSLTSSGTVRAHGNAVVGVRNPVAPPVHVRRSGGEGRVWADLHLGAMYEGPPGMVHGGVAALVLDQMLGEAAADGGAPGMTGTLTLRYRRSTPLGDCSAEAWVERAEGIKTFAQGVIRDADGTTTVEAEGVFILPRWAREAMERQGGKPPRFE